MNNFPTDKESLVKSLENRDKQFVSELFAAANVIKEKTIGKKVYLRGLLEISNICEKNCFYCGIRRGNPLANRYEISEDAIVESAGNAYEKGYGSICIQAGERHDEAFISKVTRIIRRIKEVSEGQLGITLSLGEQSLSVYKKWFEAGAHRYLLRIEASNPALYGKLHPADHSHAERVKCLGYLREAGYQVGTGVMIGLPWQTAGDLADDLLFMRDFDIDMVGMGPYLPHEDTPLTKICSSGEVSIPSREERLELSLKMVALLRIMMPDINIAATTALEVLDPKGREKAILAGANIVMPNITPTAARGDYNLYDGKKNLTESPALGEIEIGYNQWGDSLRFKSRV